jgi:hypothetical protein
LPLFQKVSIHMARGTRRELEPSQLAVSGAARAGARAVLTHFAVLLCVLLLFALPSQAAAGQTAARPSPALLRDASLCLGCHAPAVDAAELRDSVHQSLACVDCHQDIQIVPHETALAPVDCDRCHYQTQRDEFMGAEEKALEPPIHQAVKEEDARDLPTCKSCHGTHRVRPAVSEATAADKLHMVQVCDECHAGITGKYLDSVHGEALAAGTVDTPACADCHPEHSRDAAENGRDVLRGEVAATCGSCHDDPGLQERFALPGQRLASYLGSYHGTAAQLGDVRTADCASCHGNHDILSSTDPRSSTHPDNLPRTCGKCHPGVNENVTQGKVHVLASSHDEGPVYFIDVGFRWFTLSIIAALCGHITLELFGRWRRRSKQ